MVREIFVLWVVLTSMKEEWSSAAVVGCGEQSVMISGEILMHQ